MRVTQLLLDSLLPDQRPWLPNERGAIVLTVDRDVIVNIFEDETAEEVHIVSAVGYLPGIAIAAVTLDGGAAGEGHFSVHVAQPAGLVVPMRKLARSQLDEVSFCKELGSHVTAARALGAALDARATECAEPAPVWHAPQGVSYPGNTGDSARWQPCGVGKAKDGTLVVSLPLA